MNPVAFVLVMTAVVAVNLIVLLVLFVAALVA